MGRHKEIEGETRDVHSSIPIDDYNIVSESIGRDSISYYIRMKFNYDAEVIRKRRQSKQITSCLPSKSAIGSVCNNNMVVPEDNEVIELSKGLTIDLTEAERKFKLLMKGGNIEILRPFLPQTRQLYNLVDAATRGQIPLPEPKPNPYVRVSEDNKQSTESDNEPDYVIEGIHPVIGKEKVY